MDPETGQSCWEGTEDEQWEKMFTSDGMVYYKNDQMDEMNSRFGDIYNDICGKLKGILPHYLALLRSLEDREIEIVHDLAQRVLQHEMILSKVSDILAELDWYGIVTPRIKSL